VYWLSWLYAIILVVISAVALNLWLMTIVAVVLRLPWFKRAATAPLPAEAQWPTVLIQLPIYNERYVVERLIDSVAAIDYPADRLTIQVLDDSTDDTSAIARSRVAYHKARGHNVNYLHRTNRSGYKAGALDAGLKASDAELVAIFDADFVPPTDFLLRTVPEFVRDPRVGIVGTRWEHLNWRQDAFTQGIALQIDSFFGVQQPASAAMGLLMNFNGSAGLWRRRAVDDSGGWQGDTLAEDLDLSFRAQLRGWKLVYLQGVASPAELPTTVLAFKRQQFRWAKGSAQCLRKLYASVFTAPLSPFHKLEAYLHLSAYLAHSLVVVTLLFTLPLVLFNHGQTPFRWELLQVAGFAPPVMAVLGELFLHPKDWYKRIPYYPLWVLVGIGLTLTNLVAIWDAVVNTRSEFQRTPKAPGGQDVKMRTYNLPLDWTTWGETFLAFYAFVTGMLATELAPSLAPVMFIYAIGFGYTAALGFLQADALGQREAARQTQTN
jgi:cellulose synthase/poly-beta-1,6-N-acetylglucosamine synthase-like glycosyltransferase